MRLTECRIEPTKIYNDNIKAYNSGDVLIINQGGTSSGKTYAILQVLITIALRSSKSLVISIVSETLPHLKRGAMRDFFTIIEPIYNPALHNKTDSIYHLNNSKIEFFPADDESKMKGARRDILFINEANNVSKSAFDQLEPRTRVCTFIDFNPTHWFYAHELQNEKGVSFLKSTYKDNHKLDAKIIGSIESRKEKDPNWWRVYGLGEIGMIEGVVFSNWQQIESFPEGNFWCGLDFGYTNDPSALVRVMLKGDDLYVDEVLYQTGMQNPDLARFMKDSLPKYTEVFADSAEPKSIDEIYAYGVNIHPVRKGKDSIMQGIDVLHRYNLKITKRSTNLIKELRNYSWMKDKEGRYMNKPIDLFNHALDALRYAAMMKLSKEIDNTWVV
jgi:phage terminase large subunit